MADRDRPPDSHLLQAASVGISVAVAPSVPNAVDNVIFVYNILETVLLNREA